MKDINRKVMLRRRNRLTEEDIIQKSKLIKNNLLSLKEYKEAKTIMIYVSFGKEVETHNLIKEALKTKTVLVPKVKEDQIIACKINTLDDLEQGAFGILEPKTSVEFSKKKIELIILPGIVFDKLGNRIGYGKGFYDKFLKNINATKIALAFDFKVLEQVPTRKYDIKMNIIVTEKNIIQIKN